MLRDHDHLGPAPARRSRRSPRRVPSPPIGRRPMARRLAGACPSVRAPGQRPSHTRAPEVALPRSWPRRVPDVARGAKGRGAAPGTVPADRSGGSRRARSGLPGSAKLSTPGGPRDGGRRCGRAGGPGYGPRSVRRGSTRNRWSSSEPDPITSGRHSSAGNAGSVTHASAGHAGSVTHASAGHAGSAYLPGPGRRHTERHRRPVRDHGAGAGRAERDSQPLAHLLRPGADAALSRQGWQERQ
jgi:hypothetical protein